MLEAGGSRVELIEFLKEKGNPYDNHVELNDVGSSHIAFEPEDMDQAYEYLLSKGVRFRSLPRVTRRGPRRYWCATVFYDPGGFDLALFKSYQGEPVEMSAASSQPTT
tara:strand:- start:494 stop:817 length:324 start_codon:yes stop_codon:yes gene_type:complete